MTTQFSYNPNLLLIDVFLWLVLFVLARPVMILKQPRKGLKRAKTFGLFFIVLYLYCVFAFAEYDTYHTWMHFSVGGHYLKHYEPIYLWILDLVGGEYFLWRAVVWGIACFALYMTAISLKDKSYYLLFSVLLIIPVSTFFASRASSAHALTLFSFVLILTDRTLIKIKALLGLILLVCSFYLHKSNFLFIGIMTLAFLVPFKIGSKTILLSLIAFPILYIVTAFYVQDFIAGEFSLDFGKEMNIQEKAMGFATAENQYMELNALGVLSQIITKLPILMLVVYLTQCVVYKKISLGRVYSFLFVATFLCVYISFLFLYGAMSQWIFQRINYFAVFPGVIVLSKVMNLDRKKNWAFYVFVAACALNVVWTLSLRYYHWSV